MTLLPAEIEKMVDKRVFKFLNFIIYFHQFILCTVHARHKNMTMDAIYFGFVVVVVAGFGVVIVFESWH